ncbi:unnamed protein product [Dibothriocephalus latus]|uniref:Major facilitator superfamily (MFS) profile domain-containing protein n=1 Tax=Dibothriocephalus latus TaxID=60516 RepID=A0A3P6UF75_DIBLA|nr:unnamed protein product [Dibothriocephalus latus]
MIPIWGVLSVIGGFLYHLSLGYYYTVGKNCWKTFCGYSANNVLTHFDANWFPGKRNTVVGIIASGLGLGALVFTPIQTKVINPNDLQPVAGKYPDEVQERIPNAFLILGGITAAFQVIGLILLRTCPDNENKEDGESSSSSSELEKPEEDNSVDNNSTPTNSFILFREQNEEVVLPKLEVTSYSVKDALKCIDFYILFTVSFCDIVAVVLLTSTYKLYGLENQLKDSFLSGVVIGSSVFNCFGRVMWGLIVDRFSYKCPMLTFLFIWIVLFSSFPFVAAGAAGMYLFAIWVFLLFFTLAGNFVILPGATGTLFGPDNFATIYGLVYAAAVRHRFVFAFLHLSSNIFNLVIL